MSENDGDKFWALVTGVFKKMVKEDRSWEELVLLAEDSLLDNLRKKFKLDAKVAEKLWKKARGMTDEKKYDSGFAFMAVAAYHFAQLAKKLSAAQKKGDEKVETTTISTFKVFLKEIRDTEFMAYQQLSRTAEIRKKDPRELERIADFWVKRNDAFRAREEVYNTALQWAISDNFSTQKAHEIATTKTNIAMKRVLGSKGMPKKGGGFLSFLKRR